MSDSAAGPDPSSGTRDLWLGGPASGMGHADARGPCFRGIGRLELASGLRVGTQCHQTGRLTGSGWLPGPPLPGSRLFVLVSHLETRTLALA